MNAAFQIWGVGQALERDGHIELAREHYKHAKAVVQRRKT